MVPLSLMDRHGQEGARRLTATIRHLLFYVLVLSGLLDVQAVAAHARDYGPAQDVVSSLVRSATPIAPCRDDAATAALEIAAPSEFLPDLLPVEREGDAVADRPSNGAIGFLFESARGSRADHDLERKPGHGFSSRAPPVLS